MAFTQGTTSELDATSNRRVYTGTWSDGAPTGATINTPLRNIQYCTATGATAISVSGGVITLTSAATSGYWKAEGD